MPAVRLNGNEPSFIARWICATLLALFGYTINTKQAQMLKRTACVCIYPHTARLDAIIFCLVNVVLGGPFCFGVSKLFMDHWLLGRMFAFFGAFPIKAWNATSKEGTVQRVVEYLQEHPGRTFLISPEGDTDAAAWKSGFYHIARLTGRPVIIGGIDFVHHRLGVIPTLHYPPAQHTPEAQEQFVNSLQAAFRTCGFYPLYPDKSFPEVEMPDGYATSAFDHGFLSTLCGALILLYLTWTSPMFWAALALALVTVVHHFPHEHSYTGTPTRSNVVLGLALLLLALREGAQLLAHPSRALLLLFLVLCCKLAGNGYYTNCCAKSLARFHALYHVLGSAVLGLFLSAAIEPQLA